MLPWRATASQRLTAASASPHPPAMCTVLDTWPPLAAAAPETERPWLSGHPKAASQSLLMMLGCLISWCTSQLHRLGWLRRQALLVAQEHDFEVISTFQSTQGGEARQPCKQRSDLDTISCLKRPQYGLSAAFITSTLFWGTLSQGMSA